MKQPRILNRVEDNNVLQFQLLDGNVSFANAIRRVILSEIPVCCIRTESEEVNQCRFLVNTSRLHNEILKQRLSCIPIHTTDLALLPGKYELVVNVTNDTDHIMYVTTEHFQIRKKMGSDVDGEKEVMMSKEDVQRIFPPSKNGDFIEFARLRPSWGDMPGEQIHFIADFSVSTAKVSSMFNVVSKCSFSNTIDMEKVEKVLEEKKAEWKLLGLTDQDIRFQEKNFLLLDAQRYFIEDSFDFVVETIGIYENWELVVMAMNILKRQFEQFLVDLDLNTSSILIKNKSSVDNIASYDILLDGLDFTFGKLLELALYQFAFLQNKISFVSFHKPHPHLNHSFLKLSLPNSYDIIPIIQSSIHSFLPLFHI